MCTRKGSDYTAPSTAGVFLSHYGKQEGMHQQGQWSLDSLTWHPLLSLQDNVTDTDGGHYWCCRGRSTRWQEQQPPRHRNGMVHRLRMNCGLKLPSAGRTDLDRKGFVSDISCRTSRRWHLAGTATIWARTASEVSAVPGNRLHPNTYAHTHVRIYLENSSYCTTEQLPYWQRLKNKPFPC